jgi:predicted enzyme related to lactoylglutathione lyase
MDLIVYSNTYLSIYNQLIKKMANAINWFEIPAKNLDRACSFYGAVLNGEIHQQEIVGTRMGFLPHGQQEVGGALVEGDGYEPSESGPLVYLNGGQDLSDPLGRVEQAGGKVVLPKTKISDEIGYMAIFKDSEGNKVAFHSPQ